MHAYAWRGDGTLENRGAAEQWRQKDAWGQENFDSFVPEARGRFGYLVGSVVLRLRLGARMQGRIVLRRAYDAVARDDARRGIYLVKDGRVDWASDGALDRPRTLGHIGGLMGPASCADYDAGRRELFVSTQDREGSWVGVYGIGGGLRLHKRLEARLGRGRSVAVWVTR